MEKNKRTTGSKIHDLQALSRRDFLVNTALVGAGLALGPLLEVASAEGIVNRAGNGLHKGGNKMGPSLFPVGSRLLMSTQK